MSGTGGDQRSKPLYIQDSIDNKSSRPFFKINFASPGLATANQEQVKNAREILYNQFKFILFPKSFKSVTLLRV